MNKIRVAVVGYGNIGKFVIEALSVAPDFEIAGIVRRCTTCIPDEIKKYNVTTDIDTLGHVDVAILCTPTREVPKYAKEYLAKGINTVDSFDIHSSISELIDTLSPIANETGKVAIVSAGWDPGSDSIVRTLMQAAAPKGITYTNFGPGMSMGHSVAARSKDGVKNAISMTIPLGTGIHRRMIYIEVEDGYHFNDVANAIKKDPYFASDETHVIKVNSVDEVKDMGHGVNMRRKGVSGCTQNQNFEFNMSINNPALTAQMLVNAARATTKQQPGVYTLIEIPVIDLLPGDRKELIKQLV